jgi:hypothetical protein
MQISVVCLPCFKVFHTQLHFWGPNDTKLEEQNNEMCEHRYNCTDILHSRFIDEWQWECGFYKWLHERSIA